MAMISYFSFSPGRKSHIIYFNIYLKMHLANVMSFEKYASSCQITVEIIWHWQNYMYVYFHVISDIPRSWVIGRLKCGRKVQQNILTSFSILNRDGMQYISTEKKNESYGSRSQYISISLYSYLRVHISLTLIQSVIFFFLSIVIFRADDIIHGNYGREYLAHVL